MRQLIIIIQFCISITCFGQGFSLPPNDPMGVEVRLIMPDTFTQNSLYFAKLVVKPSKRKDAFFYVGNALLDLQGNSMEGIGIRGYIRSNNLAVEPFENSSCYQSTPYEHLAPDSIVYLKLFHLGCDLFYRCYYDKAIPNNSYNTIFQVSFHDGTYKMLEKKIYVKEPEPTSYRIVKGFLDWAKVNRYESDGLKFVKSFSDTCKNKLVISRLLQCGLINPRLNTKEGLEYTKTGLLDLPERDFVLHKLYEFYKGNRGLERIINDRSLYSLLSEVMDAVVKKDPELAYWWYGHIYQDHVMHYNWEKCINQGKLDIKEEYLSPEQLKDLKKMLKK